MLVLLGLFPIVMLESLFLSPRLASLNFSLALFIGNTISVALTTWLTMPVFIKALDWWLFPKPDAPKSVHWKGTLLIFALYAFSVAIFGNLCDIRARRASVCSPSSRKQQTPPFPL